MTGPSPVDRGKPGSKIHALSDRAGLPLVRRRLRREHQRLLRARASRDGDTRDQIPPWPTQAQTRQTARRQGLRPPELRRWVRDRGIKVRIARKGIESSTKLGKHRWVIERTMAWFTGYRRLTLRYERKAEHFLAFLTLGASLTCYKKLRKLTT